MIEFDESFVISKQYMNISDFARVMTYFFVIPLNEKNLI